MFNRVGNAPRAQPARNARGGAQRSPRPSGEARTLAFCSERIRQAKELEYRISNSEWRIFASLMTPNFVIRHSLLGVRHSRNSDRSRQCVWRRAAGTAQACSGLRVSRGICLTEWATPLALNRLATRGAVPSEAPDPGAKRGLSRFAASESGERAGISNIQFEMANLCFAHDSQFRHSSFLVGCSTFPK